ncbi:QWRF motif-containing protein 2-like isoform X2 [Carex rostrata]
MVVAGPTPAREDQRRPPLTPSDNSNAAVASSRRPRNKEIASRYLSSYTASPSPSPTPSTSSSYSSPSTRRFPSPAVSSRSVPTPHQRRSSSVDRSRPSTASTTTSTSSTTTTTTTTRSLAVSFQGGSFFYQTSRAKPTPTPGRISLEYSQQNRPWPAAVRSLDYSSTGHSGGVEDKGGNGEVSGSSDTDSVSSGSNSGSHEFMLPPRAKVTSRGICVPARFFQESHDRQRPVRHPSPSKITSPSPTRGMSSPLRARGGSPAVSQANQQPFNAPSILSFAMEVRRAKKGEYRIEEAHLLRLLDNRHLQWRWVNAKFNSTIQDQKQISEKNLYNAWRSISELRESVAIKRMKLQLLNQDLKLASILTRQVLDLDEWSEMESEHSSSLVGAIEALKASTLRLPVVGGAKADIQKLKEVTSAAMNTFLLMESSNSFLSKVHRTSSSVHQLGEVVLKEHMLVHQCRDILSTVVALHVKQCSLQGQLLQLTGTLSHEQT